MSAPNVSPPRLALSVAEVASSLGVSRQTIDREIREGRLSAVRSRDRVVIPVAAVRAYLKRNQTRS